MVSEQTTCTTSTGTSLVDHKDKSKLNISIGITIGGFSKIMVVPSTGTSKAFGCGTEPFMMTIKDMMKDAQG